MDILIVLIPIALGFLVIALAVFFWAIRNGQYDDMQSQGLKIVLEEKQSDDQIKQDKNKPSSEQKENES